MADMERRADRQEVRLDTHERRITRLEVAMAKSEAWRAEHDRHHERTDRRHADMPGRAIAAGALLITFLMFLFTFYTGGFGP